jgi:cellulose synthase/poly-beta-1,6-N-acetylglucosamine synthase-like glycosyltransferase
VIVFPIPVVFDSLSVISMLRRPLRLSRRRVDDYTIIIPCYNGYGPPLYWEEGRTVIVEDAASKPEAIIRGLSRVGTKYVVILDADTIPSEDLGRVCATLEEAGADIASAIVLPIPCEGGLVGFQSVEYALAMKVRRLSPHLTSGAFIVAKTDSLRAIMRRHSGNFDGDDTEIGLIAKRLGMRVVHLDSVAVTRVPSGLRSLLRQRVAWTMGFIRLAKSFFRQLHVHALYGLIIFLGLTPLKILSLDTVIHLVILTIYLAYLAIALIGASDVDGIAYKLAYPFYGLAMAMLVPLATLAYYVASLMRRGRG